MPTVTFSSRLHKDKTVYAVAGSHRKTILELAKENHVPIDFSCGNGECGTCLVKVFPLERKKNRMANPLTEHEVEVLRYFGKLSLYEFYQMSVDDLMPNEWRLACQMVVRDEDILVEYPSQ